MRVPKKRTSSRKTRVPAGKAPLTYYRSGSKDSAASPFKKTSVAASPRFKKIQKILINLVTAVFLILILAHSLIVNSSPKLVLDSQIYHPKGVYYAIAAHELQSLKNHNKVSFNEKSIINALRTKFPEISDASLELPIFSQIPTIRLHISKPSLFLNNNSSSYIIDDKGVAVARADELPKIKDLPVVIDESGFSAIAGKQAFSGSGVNFIQVLLAQCNRAQVPVKSLNLPPLAGEINLHTSDRGYYVKFFLGGDVLKQAGQFLAARHQFESSGNQPAEYLDVRVPGKIFYK